MTSPNPDPIPLIQTKLHRPQVPDNLVPRPRLAEWLDRSRKRPLILVSAPAGYGKSTLISSWVKSLDLPTAWVSLDETDNDLVVFLSYFLAAIQSISPQSVDGTQAQLLSAELPPLKVLARNIINELNDIKGDYVLVLDDLHLIREQAIYDLLNELLLFPPPGMHLVLITRSDPPISLVKLRARSQMTEIRTQNLRFTTEETSTLLRNMLEIKKIKKKTVAKLEDLYEGWVTGLRLAALAFQHRVGKKHIMGKLSARNRYVNEYLMSEVLAKQSPEFIDWLLKTAILDRFCGSLCETVCKSSDDSEDSVINGDLFLEWLEASNLFVIPLDDQGGWFRYHQLFREFLQQELQRRASHNEIANLHSRASGWFASNGQIDKALYHALEAGDAAAAVDLVARHRHDLSEKEQWHRLDHWLQMFAPHVIEENIELLTAKAWVLQQWARIPEWVETLAQIQVLLDQEPPDSKAARHIEAEVSIMQAGLLFNKADIQQMPALMTQALEDLPSGRASIRGIAYLYLAYTTQSLGDSDRAIRVLHDALANQNGSSNAQRGWLLMGLCFCYWSKGDLTSLRRTAKQYLEFSQKNDLRGSQVYARLFLGRYYYHRNKLSKAEKHLQRALRDRHFVLATQSADGAFALALTQQALGKPGLAWKTARSIAKYLVELQSSDFFPHVEALQAELAMHDGNIAEAARWAIRFDDNPAPMMQRFYIPQLTQVKILLAHDSVANHEQAAKLLSKLQEYVESIHNTRVLMEILVLQALLADILGENDVALSKLEEAVQLAEPGGWIRFFVELGPKIEKLLVRLRDQGLKKGYINQILKAFPGSEGDLADIDQRRLFDPLTARELEVLTLLAQQLSNKEIAAKLHISKGTVTQHTHKIYQKLGVKSRWQAVTKAADLGLLSAVS